VAPASPLGALVTPDRLITHRHLQIFLRFDGDIDMFSRAATREEREAVPEDEVWANIERILSSLVLVERGLVAPTYADEIVATLKRLAADDSVAEEIRRVARKQATRSAYLDTKRAGARPRTTPTNPHTQLDQNAPRPLQEKIFALARSLPGVVVGPSHVSVPGARAFHLPSCANPADAGFMIGREFAHLHPPDDGSLHMSLPVEIVRTVVDNGWAELHPLAGKHGLAGNIVMVYGPRDDAELDIIAALVRASHDAACGDNR
jgi:hypothetical protein